MHTGFIDGGFLDPHRVSIQRNVGLLRIAQDAPDGLTYATIATDHYMVMQVGVECADFFEFRFFVGLAVQACGDVGCGAQQ